MTQRDGYSFEWRAGQQSVLTTPQGEEIVLDTVNNVSVIGTAVLRSNGVEIAAADLEPLFEEFVQSLAEGALGTLLEEFVASPEMERITAQFAGVAQEPATPDPWARVAASAFARAHPCALLKAGVHTLVAFRGACKAMIDILIVDASFNSS